MGIAWTADGGEEEGEGDDGTEGEDEGSQWTSFECLER